MIFKMNVFTDFCLAVTKVANARLIKSKKLNAFKLIYLFVKIIGHVPNEKGEDLPSPPKRSDIYYLFKRLFKQYNAMRIK